MFEIVVTIHLVVRNFDMVFISDTRYATKALCEDAIPEGYVALRRHVLDHMIEKFEIERKCRPVEEGA